MNPFIWSFTALDHFESCPRKFKHKFIDRIKEPMTPAMQRGIDIHKSLENYIKCRESGIDIPLIDKFLPLADSVKRMAEGKKLVAEQKMGVLGNMEPCGFFDDHVWGRGAADFIILGYPAAFIGDWKDGKADKPWSYVLKYEKPTQLVILALFIFKHYPRIEKITACNIWLEHGKFGKVYTFTRAMEAALWTAVVLKIQAMERAISEDRFITQPGPLCKYCPVRSCEFNKS